MWAPPRATQRARTTAISSGGRFGFSVMAVDASGKAAEVEKLSFDVLPKPQFKIVTTNVRANTAGDGYTDPGATTTYIVGSA